MEEEARKAGRRNCCYYVGSRHTLGARESKGGSGQRMGRRQVDGLGDGWWKGRKQGGQRR